MGGWRKATTRLASLPVLCLRYKRNPSQPWVARTRTQPRPTLPAYSGMPRTLAYPPRSRGGRAGQQSQQFVMAQPRRRVQVSSAPSRGGGRSGRLEPGPAPPSRPSDTPRMATRAGVHAWSSAYSAGSAANISRCPPPMRQVASAGHGQLRDCPAWRPGPRELSGGPTVQPQPMRSSRHAAGRGIAASAGDVFTVLPPRACFSSLSVPAAGARWRAAGN